MKSFVTYCGKCKIEIPYSKVKVTGLPFIDGKLSCPYCNAELEISTQEEN